MQGIGFADEISTADLVFRRDHRMYEWTRGRPCRSVRERQSPYPRQCGRLDARPAEVSAYCTPRPATTACAAPRPALPVPGSGLGEAPPGTPEPDRAPLACRLFFHGLRHDSGWQSSSSLSIVQLLALNQAPARTAERTRIFRTSGPASISPWRQIAAHRPQARIPPGDPSSPTGPIHLGETAAKTDPRAPSDRRYPPLVLKLMVFLHRLKLSHHAGSGRNGAAGWPVASVSTR